MTTSNMIFMFGNNRWLKKLYFSKSKDSLKKRFIHIFTAYNSPFNCITIKRLKHNSNPISFDGLLNILPKHLNTNNFFMIFIMKLRKLYNISYLKLTLNNSTSSNSTLSFYIKAMINQHTELPIIIIISLRHLYIS